MNSIQYICIYMNIISNPLFNKLNIYTYKNIDIKRWIIETTLGFYDIGCVLAMTKALIFMGDWILLFQETLSQMIIPEYATVRALCKPWLWLLMAATSTVSFSCVLCKFGDMGRVLALWSDGGSSQSWRKYHFHNSFFI